MGKIFGIWDFRLINYHCLSEMQTLLIYKTLFILDYLWRSKIGHPKLNYYIDVIYPKELEIKQMLQNGLIIFICIDLRLEFENGHFTHDSMTSVMTLISLRAIFHN